MEINPRSFGPWLASDTPSRHPSRLFGLEEVKAKSFENLRSSCSRQYRPHDSLCFFIFGIRLPQGRSGGVFLLPVLGGYFIPSVLIDQWGIRKFRREWIERGGLPVPSGFATSPEV